MDSDSAGINKNKMATRLARGELVTCMNLKLVPVPAIAHLAQAAGCDAIFVDFEHSTFSVAEVSGICHAALSSDITALVRVPSLDPHLITRVLDGGAMGVIVPNVLSAADAAEVVRACRFPPRGRRSISRTLPQNGYVNPADDQALLHLDSLTTVVVMIESEEGVAHVEEIAAVPGVDMIFVGCGDLGVNLGVASVEGSAVVRAACERVAAACKRNHIHFGLGGAWSAPGLTEDMVRLGARFLTVGSDMGFLLEGARRTVKGLRERLLLPTGEIVH